MALKATAWRRVLIAQFEEYFDDALLLLERAGSQRQGLEITEIAHVFMLVKSPTWRLYVPQRACSEQGGICVLGEVLTGQHVIPGGAQPPVLDAACI